MQFLSCVKERKHFLRNTGKIEVTLREQSEKMKDVILHKFSGRIFIFHVVKNKTTKIRSYNNIKMKKSPRFLKIVVFTINKKKKKDIKK